MKFLIKVALATALMSGALTGVSRAHTAEQEQLCSGDALRLCGSEIPDVGRITACMIQKRAQLSRGCQSVFQTQSRASYQPSRPSRPIRLAPKKYR